MTRLISCLNSLPRLDRPISFFDRDRHSTFPLAFFLAFSFSRTCLSIRNNKSFLLLQTMIENDFVEVVRGRMIGEKMSMIHNQFFVDDVWTYFQKCMICRYIFGFSDAKVIEFNLSGFRLYVSANPETSKFIFYFPLFVLWNVFIHEAGISENLENKRKTNG